MHRSVRNLRKQMALKLHHNLLCRYCAVLACIGVWLLFVPVGRAATKPNIVVILADDLGYGDVKCFNPHGKISTPHLDRLADEGMIFTDAHSSSAVCTPTRYALLTGRYNWRSRLKSGVQGGMSPPLIEPGRLTLPSFLQRNGYHTAAVGKWHLGMDWTRRANTPAFGDGIERGEDGWRVDFAAPIAHGPNAMGFNYYFGIAASLDMVPYTFIENDRTTKLPTVDKQFPQMLGRTNRMTRRGPAAADFEVEDVLPTLTRKAVNYIEERATDAQNGRPFFLYLPLNAPHTPIAPTKEWQGKSGLNPYADFVMQVDSEIGELLGTLDRFGLAQNTLVIFTSDNGCSPEADFDDLRRQGHDSSADFRGAKADIYEGGHRVPFIARWPGRVKPGSRSSQLISLNDIFATCAEMLSQKLPPNAAEDSVSFLGTLEGQAQPARESLVHHSINGSFAIRETNWKLIFAPDSGGWSAPRPGTRGVKDLPIIQLYDLVNDAREANNVQATHPEIVQRLTALLHQQITNGRSTPGPIQTNTTAVSLPAIQSASLGAGQRTRPNILFILADDMGFSDLGCYGGEVATPILDGLATNGLRFTQFYNTARCWPSRAALLTGYYPQQIRMDPPRGRLPEWAELLPQRLKPIGYRSYHSGKWHVNGSPRPLADGGFDRSYRLEDHDRNFYPTNHSLDDLRQLPVPRGSNYYTTSAVADFMIQCLRQHASNFAAQPFFGYLAFTVPHFPLQAPQEDISPYRDKYRVGWDVVRKKRHEQQLKLGILNAALSGREPEIVPHWNLTQSQLEQQISPHEIARAIPWDDLTEPQKQFQATKMAIHAAMISRMDREIGRVLDQLKTMAVYENTILMFASDNGASGEFLNRGDKHNPAAESGSGESYLCLGPGWSTAANTPFRLHKSWVHEGGIATPLIVHWPAGLQARGEFRRTPGHLIDIVPTLLEVTGPHPKPQSPTPPFPGRSLIPAFEKDVEIPRDHLFFHHEHNRALRIGDWKVVSKRPGTNDYALYNLRSDRTELNNLAQQQPNRVAEMAARWQELETEFRATAENKLLKTTPSP